MVLKVFTGDRPPCEAPTKRDHEAAQQLVDEYIKQTTEASQSEILFEVQPKDFEAGREILKTAREQQVAIVVDAAVRLVRSGTDDFTTDLEFPHQLKPVSTELLCKSSVDDFFARSSRLEEEVDILAEEELH